MPNYFTLFEEIDGIASRTGLDRLDQKTRLALYGAALETYKNLTGDRKLERPEGELLREIGTEYVAGGLPTLRSLKETWEV